MWRKKTEQSKRGWSTKMRPIVLSRKVAVGLTAKADENYCGRRKVRLEGSGFSRKVLYQQD